MKSIVTVFCLLTASSLFAEQLDFPVTNSDRAQNYLDRALTVLEKYSDIRQAKEARKHLEKNWVVIDFEKKKVVDLERMGRSGKHCAFVLVSQQDDLRTPFRAIPPKDRRGVFRFHLVASEPKTDIFQAAELIFNIATSKAYLSLESYSDESERNARALVIGVKALNNFFRTVTQGALQEVISSYATDTIKEWQIPGPKEMDELYDLFPSAENWTEQSIRVFLLVVIHNANAMPEKTLFDVLQRLRIAVPVKPGQPFQLEPGKGKPASAPLELCSGDFYLKNSVLLFSIALES